MHYSKWEHVLEERMAAQGNQTAVPRSTITAHQLNVSEDTLLNKRLCFSARQEESVSTAHTPLSASYGPVPNT